MFPPSNAVRSSFDATNKRTPTVDSIGYNVACCIRIPVCRMQNAVVEKVASLLYTHCSLLACCRLPISGPYNSGMSKPTCHARNIGCSKTGPVVKLLPSFLRYGLEPESWCRASFLPVKACPRRTFALHRNQSGFVASFITDPD